jgi:hypothetical protein
VEAMVLCLHVGGFICILVPLWVLGPRGNSHEIWTVFEDGGGWGSSTMQSPNFFQTALSLLPSWSRNARRHNYANHGVSRC